MQKSFYTADLTVAFEWAASDISLFRHLEA